MLWFLVWTVLVLGALATLGLLGWRLWRQARALGAELARAAQVGAALEQSADQVLHPEPIRVPGVLGDPATVAQARATRERVRQQRRDRSAWRLARVEDRWRRLGLTR